MDFALRESVQRNHISRIFWLFTLAGLLFALSGQKALAFDFTFAAVRDSNRITLNFDRPVEAFTLQRTADKNLRLHIPGQTPPADDKNVAVPTSASLVQKVNRLDEGLDISLKTNEFGYLRYLSNNNRSLVIEIYPDPLGGKWQPPQGTESSPEPAASNATPTDNASEPDNQTAAETAEPDNPEPGLNATTEPTANVTANATAEGTGNATAELADNQTSSGAAEANQTPPVAEANQIQAATPADNQTVPSEPANQTEALNPGPVLNLPPLPETDPEAAAPSPPSSSVVRPVRQTNAPFYGVPSSFRGKVNHQGPEAAVPQTVKIIPAQNAPLPPQPPAPPEPSADNASSANQSSVIPGIAPDLAAEQPETPPVAATLTAELANSTNSTGSPADLLREAQEAVEARAFDLARTKLTTLTARPDASKELMEQALYTLADIGFIRYKTDEEINYNYPQLVYDFNSAMSYNPESPRVPSALLKLSIINLKAGNMPEARAYFNILKKQYPTNDVIPILYFSWAEYHMKRQDYQKAADLFQTVLQDYSENRFAREAALNLTICMAELGYNRQAYETAAYVEKRWPRYYVEYIPFLKILGDAAYRVDDLDKAKKAYWGYYNLAPNEPDSDLVLAKLGDIYLKTSQQEAAEEIYNLAIGRFPGRDGAIISMIRLAEAGVYDQLSLTDMAGMYAKPGQVDPALVYQEILTKYPDSPLAKVALLKLGMYQLWQKNYRQALETLNQFPTRYPGDPLLPQAQAAAQAAFGGLVQMLAEERNYPLIVNAWRSFPILHTGEMTPATTVGLATSLWMENNPSAALELILPFFNGPMVPEYSDLALQLAASIYLENKDWVNIIKLADNVGLWDISPRSAREFYYALALAYENMGFSDRSGPLWIVLAEDQILPIERRGYPLYYLAMEAQRKNDLANARIYGEEALSALMVAEPKDNEKIKNLLHMLVQINDASGRYEAALHWTGEYAKFLSPASQEWAAERYQTANIYLKLGDRAKWGQALSELASSMPDSRYGKLAASELNNYSLEKTHKGFGG